MNTCTKKYFSDIVVDFLIQQNVECVAFNPGASFRGIHDSLVHHDNSPDIFMVCHEEIAIAMAHGYFKASNRHMAVFIHSNVGLLHASMAIFNAWCDRVPLFLIGGNGPIDAAKRRPWIDWIHTSQNIESVVKDFVKWCDQPISQRATMESMYRGFKLMNTEMPAPIYIAIDFDVQEQKLESNLCLLPKDATIPSKLPGADQTFINNLVNNLIRAQMPVLIVDFNGRNPDTVLPLITIAESIGMAVIDRGNRFNFPNNHPLNVSHISADILKTADFVLAIEVQDLAGALASFLGATESGLNRNNVKLVTINTNDILLSKWSADYQQFVHVDNACIADTLQTIQNIQNQIILKKSELFKNDDERYERKQKISTLHHDAKNKWNHEVRIFSENKSKIHVSVAVKEIFNAVKDKQWMLTNTGSLTIDGWVKKLWALDRSGSYLGLNGGGGLGYGLGASIGAAIARCNDKTLCINLQADGDFLYTPSALWTLSSYNIPLLVIVMNNQLYLNSTQHANVIAKNRNREGDLSHIATSFYDMPVDFIQLAQSFGIHTLPVITSVDEIQQTVISAAEYISTHNKPVLIEIIME